MTSDSARPRVSYYLYLGKKTQIQSGDKVTCHGNNTYSLSRNNLPIYYCISGIETADNKFIEYKIQDYLFITAAAVNLQIVYPVNARREWVFK